MSLSKISRLIQLIGLLQAGKGATAGSLAKHCQVSRRTIFRDLEVLRRARVPLLYDGAVGAYRIPGTYFLPPTHFTTEEALAVLVLCREMGRDRSLPLYGAAQAAAIKLESSLPAPLREDVRELSAAVQIRLEPNCPLVEQRDIYHQLLHSITARRQVRIQYDSFSEERLIETRLSPYRLLFSRRSWYVIGRSSLHREIRTFNVSRVRRLECLDDTFHTPRSFSVERYLGNAWHLIAEPGPDFHVVVRFERLVARNVAEVEWHKTQRCEPRDDGRMDFVVTVSGLNEISWWILGYGDQAEVLQPQALRELVRQRATRMVELYDKPRAEHT